MLSLTETSHQATRPKVWLLFYFNRNDVFKHFKDTLRSTPITYIGIDKLPLKPLKIEIAGIKEKRVEIPLADLVLFI